MSAFTTSIHVRSGHVGPAGNSYCPRIDDDVHKVDEELSEYQAGVRSDN